MADLDTDYEIATATMRTALVVWRMALGWQPTTDDIARKFGMSRQGAGELMKRISGIVPICADDIHGNQHNRPKWRIADNVVLTPVCQTQRQED